MIRQSAFVGYESYDLIFYLARVLSILGNTVAVVDHSRRRDVIRCFTDSEDDTLVDYDGITVIADNTDFSDFDYVLASYGNDWDGKIRFFDDVFFVTDYQKHNIEALRNIPVTDDQYLFLVIRDRISTKITADYVTQMLGEYGFDSEGVLTLEDSDDDLNNKLLIQYNSVKKTKRFSPSITQFIITVLESDFDEKGIKQAINAVRR